MRAPPCACGSAQTTKSCSDGAGRRSCRRASAPIASSCSKTSACKSGGAIIETTHGEVDAQLESKLAQLGNALWTFVMNVDSTPTSGEA